MNDEVQRLLDKGRELEERLIEIRAFLKYFSKTFGLHLDLTNWEVIPNAKKNQSTIIT
jgi:hypothetical protein